MHGLKFLRVAWPAFLAACALELLVFAVVDPTELQWSGQPLAVTRQSLYTLAFFAFWLVSGLSNAITLVLWKSAAELNACPFRPGERPPGCPHEQAR